MQKRNASLLILTGGTCMSFVGLVLRLIEQADGFQILFYRSISLALMVALVACLKRRVSPWAFLASLDRHDLAMGTALALAFTTYIFAMLATTVASTLFILTAAPFLAALIGWAWIGERPKMATWLAMAAAALGVGLMIGDGITTGRTIGNLTALFSALMFALMLVLARRSGKSDVLGGTFLGGAIACLLALASLLVIGTGIEAPARDIALALFMGAFTIGFGIALVTWGTPFVPAAEVSLLVLIESVLGPVWVWVFLGEAMSGAEMLGGGIVLAAVAAVAVLGGRQRPLAGR